MSDETNTSSQFIWRTAMVVSLVSIVFSGGVLIGETRVRLTRVENDFAGMGGVDAEQSRRIAALEVRTAETAQRLEALQGTAQQIISLLQGHVNREE